MKGKTTRGQAALEYLITYGWAILAIVIIAGVLWYFGVFNPAKWTGDKQCGGFDSFVCQDFKMNTTGVLTMVLNNKVGAAVTVSTSGCTPTAVAAGANTTCTLTGYPAGTAGNTYDQQTVTVAFTNTRSGIAHNSTGFVSGKYE